jgi:hypothetical protein
MRLIEIGGQQRPVLFTINALAEFEAITGTSVFDMDKMSTTMLSLTGCRALVYVGLKAGARRNRDTFRHSIEDVGDWLTSSGEKLGEVMNAFSEDMAANFPTAKEGSEAPEDKKN